MSAAKNRQAGSGHAGRSYKPSGVFKTGAIALAFLIVGYQVALFVQRAAQNRIVSNRDRPDTVYVVERALAEKVLGVGEAAKPDSKSAEGAAVRSATDTHQALAKNFRERHSSGTSLTDSAGSVVVRKSSPHSPEAEAVYRNAVPRRVESFRFNPNTASLEDFVRLGFSEKQAQSILNYREKGGKFRRKGDFAKSFVVADSVYKRLEPFIDIPKTDINKADSAAFDALPGIGGWTAAKMVEYRSQLHGYSCPEQLMEIWHFDQERYDGLKDLITCSPAPPYPFWSLPADSLRLHPHVRSWQTARAIVFYREHNPPDRWIVEGLLSAGILTEDQAEKLKKCKLE
ncbi:MAG: helix-hairpin-helix domain-containing protein [Bacteroidales bacterium]|nr:helix-hairpin-helix domain-containing protein [Bacteroidales bacterium]